MLYIFIGSLYCFIDCFYTDTYGTELQLNWSTLQNCQSLSCGPISKLIAHPCIRPMKLSGPAETLSRFSTRPAAAVPTGVNRVISHPGKQRPVPFQARTTVFPSGITRPWASSGPDPRVLGSTRHGLVRGRSPITWSDRDIPNLYIKVLLVH